MSASPPDPNLERRASRQREAEAAQLSEGLKRLASSEGKTGWRLGSRF